MSRQPIRLTQRGEYVFGALGFAVFVGGLLSIVTVLAGRVL